MSKSNLENSIQQAAGEFAFKIVEAVRGATLQELIAMQSEGQTKKPGRKPGRKPGPKPRKKPGPKPGQKRAKPGPKPGAKRAKPGPKPKAKGAKKAATKKRVVKNYPKCVYPRCNNNRFVRGKGYCGDHWRKWQEGKIKGPETYKKK